MMRCLLFKLLNTINELYDVHEYGFFGWPRLGSYCKSLVVQRRYIMGIPTKKLFWVVRKFIVINRGVNYLNSEYFIYNSYINEDSIVNHNQII